MKLIIDIADWKEEFDEQDIILETEDDVILVSEREDRPTPMQLGRHAVVAVEEGGKAIAAHKLTLNIGAATQISRIISKQMYEAKTKEGKKIKVRKYTCPVPDGDGDGDDGRGNAIVDSSSEQGYNDAINYLRNVVPGNIYSRLAIIATYDGNGAVESYAEELVNTIREMVEKLR